jgi:hypothetical protein
MDAAEYLALIEAGAADAQLAAVGLGTERDHDAPLRPRRFGARRDLGAAPGETGGSGSLIGPAGGPDRLGDVADHVIVAL